MPSRGLETIARNIPSNVTRIADVLAQLLEATELSATKTSCSALFAIDARAAFEQLFTKAATGQDLALRKGVMEFLQPQLKNQSAALKKDPVASAALCASLKGILSSGQTGLMGQNELKFFVQALISLCPYGNNPEKIKADATLKAELGAIAVAVSGIGAGALNITHVVAIGSIMMQKDKKESTKVSGPELLEHAASASAMLWTKQLSRFIAPSNLSESQVGTLLCLFCLLFDALLR